MKNTRQELTIIQKTYDLILWFVPIIDRFPRSYKFNLGDRIQSQMFSILEELVIARYEKTKAERLESVNVKLDVLRYHGRLLLDLKVIDGKKFHYVSEQINGIGIELGGWIKQQRENEKIR